MRRPDHPFVDAIEILFFNPDAYKVREQTRQDVQMNEIRRKVTETQWRVPAVSALVSEADNEALTDWVIEKYLEDYDETAPRLFRGDGLSRAAALVKYASSRMQERMLWLLCAAGYIGRAKELVGLLGRSLTQDEMLALAGAYVGNTATRSEADEDELRRASYEVGPETTRMVEEMLQAFDKRWRETADF